MLRHFNAVLEGLSEQGYGKGDGEIKENGKTGNGRLWEGRLGFKKKREEGERTVMEREMGKLKKTGKGEKEMFKLKKTERRGKKGYAKCDVEVIENGKTGKDWVWE